ncbi:MAG: acyl carrier protein [Lachnospiraceae bacterium]|nr:acyl carrier protein [Lachnospiraceae bacterium]MBR3684384.1 acyl carrier protein [Lachnospiraceae bacterium]
MKEKILALITEVLKVPEGTITEETQISEVEAWDSLMHVMIIGELEDRLGISFSVDEALELANVKQIIEKAEQ